MINPCIGADKTKPVLDDDRAHTCSQDFVAFLQQELHDARILFVAGLDGKDIHVGRILALDEKPVLRRGKARRERVVSVDNRADNIGKNAGKRGSLDFLELDEMPVFGGRPVVPPELGEEDLARKSR